MLRLEASPFAQAPKKKKTRPDHAGDLADVEARPDELAELFGADARKAGEAAPLDRRRAVLKALLDAVIVKLATRRGRVFDPNRLDLEWVVRWRGLPAPKTDRGPLTTTRA